jgi:hypothetical protein
VFRETRNEAVPDWPDPAGIVGTSAVEISLTYRGPLPSATREDKKSDRKHLIRMQFSEQLAEVWQREPILQFFRDKLTLVPVVNRRPEVPPSLPGMNPHYLAEMCGFKWIPLITRTNGLACHLDILLKRRSDPGEIIVSSDDGGDLDNRLKILFDALRMPLSTSEVPGNMWGGGAEAFALLEDDSLISKLTIEARRLNTKPDDSQGADYVEVDINVALKTIRSNGLVSGYM